MSSQPLNRYKADLREIQFLLFEQLKMNDLLGKAPYENWDQDTVKQVLDETYRFACEVTGPYNAIGDAEGCKLENGRVKTPTGFKEAWKKLYEAGWKSLAIPEEYGGQGAPHTLQAQVEEFLTGSNTAWNMYSGLAMGAAELIHSFGSDRQKKLFVNRMYSGDFGGTMCLSEPQAGSDVGAATTSAKKNADGTYSIKGTKCWISGGDHDCAENIIHLVLARIEGAGPGTKGLSLFIVPAVHVNEDGSLGKTNDVKVASIEHKMGINGSATCVLQFGEDDACVGELVGDAEHQGMRQMFQMMNFARIGVGIQGVALASTAYLNALEYARDRKQGSSAKNFKDPSAPRVAIIEHADVRRMLLDMKSRVEGIRALIMKLTMHQDYAHALEGKDDEQVAYHKGQVDLLTPLVKAYSSEQAFRIGETAIQIHGGAGYTRDFPVEQYTRDAKIFTIYEGTTHIQALDLVARKVGQQGGRNTQQFFFDIQKFVASHKADADLGPSIELLGQCQEAVFASAMQLLMWFQSGQIDMAPLVANRFLEMMSELSVGWLLLEGAVVAAEAKAKLPEGHKDHAFYEGRKFSALYYARNVLPDVLEKAKIIGTGDKSPIEITDASFAAGW